MLLHVTHCNAGKKNDFYSVILKESKDIKTIVALSLAHPKGTVCMYSGIPLELRNRSHNSSRVMVCGSSMTPPTMAL